MSAAKPSFTDVIVVPRGEAVTLGLLALLIGWTAASAQADAVLVFTLLLEGVVSWIGHRIGGSVFTWLSLPFIGFLGWLLGGANAWMTLLGSLLTVTILTWAAFLEVRKHRLWVSMLALGLIVSSIGLGLLTPWTLLVLLAIPHLYQSVLKQHSSQLWIEWVIVMLGGLVVGHWIRILIR
jgi:hypothetical protein